MLVCLMGTDFESIYGMYRGILSENMYKAGIPAAAIPFILTDIHNFRFSQAQNTRDLPSQAVPKESESSSAVNQAIVKKRHRTTEDLK